MNAAITKEFSFHAAHQLPNHDGPCRNLHGHTYKVEVKVYGRITDSPGSPKEGMVLDFTELKKTYKEFIEPLVEHQNLNETLKDEVPVTTAEHIAAWMFRMFHERHPQVHMVRVWETPTSSAEIRNGDLLKP